MSYETPKSRNVAELFKALEAAKKRSVLQSYAISQTTLEQVFLNVASAANAKRDAPPAVRGPSPVKEI